MNRRLARLAGLVVLWGAVELLERVAYAAGVDDAALVADNTLAALHVDEDLDDDELEGVDVSDVVFLHVTTFHGPDAPRAGECAC